MIRRASGRRLCALAAAAFVTVACDQGAHAAETASFVLQMPDGPVRVDRIGARVDGPRPAVIVLSGSKGFDSDAYADMFRKLNDAGLEVFALHALSRGDLDMIAKAGNARARIAYYATALRRWTAVVHALVDRLTTEPRTAGGIGVLGISLGAEIAAEAVAERGGVGALVLVDGGFPDRYGSSARALPPLMLIWGGADRIFPPTVARRLVADVQDRGGRAALKIYDGSGHDFFVRPGATRAAEAQTDAATFLAAHLK